MTCAAYGPVCIEYVVYLTASLTVLDKNVLNISFDLDTLIVQNITTTIVRIEISGPAPSYDYSPMFTNYTLSVVERDFLVDMNMRSDIYGPGIGNEKVKIYFDDRANFREYQTKRRYLKVDSNGKNILETRELSADLKRQLYVQNENRRMN